jgi:hypothetical protein
LQDAFTKAQQSTGLEIEMTGVLGKRTKFQTFETPQLILKASSKSGICKENMINF